MVLCVSGIIGLQLFWNYQNYKNAVKVFDQNINEALKKAVDKETLHRRLDIIKRFEGWLADTAVVTITADHNNRDSATMFYIRDTHPRFAEDLKRQTEFGLADFKEKLDHITPAAKKALIQHFGQRILLQDLEKGIVYNYTQTLGDSLEKVFSASKVSLPALWQYYKAELHARGIHADFVLNPKQDALLYLSKPVNTNFRKPFKNDFIFAGIKRPESYFFNTIKWVIITSLLLIIITIGCFFFTIKTLLSQEKLSALKDDFVNNMTHELNTPIASIKITAEALKSFKHRPETQSEYLDIISYQAEKLSTLTTTILNTNALIHTRGSLTPVNLYQLIEKAITEVQPLVLNAQAHISFNASVTNAVVNAEEVSLLNVLINLIDNALRYTIENPLITITLSQTGAYAYIAVADHGIGIPLAFKDQIFERFFRIPQGNQHDVKGFGLGLSYVKQTINEHHGAVWVKHNDPRGSIFTIKLPLHHA